MDLLGKVPARGFKPKSFQTTTFSSQKMQQIGCARRIREVSSFSTCTKALYQYQNHMDNVDRNSLIYKVMQDMKTNPQIDCWNSRINKIKKLLNIRRLYGKPEKMGKTLTKF